MPLEKRPGKVEIAWSDDGQAVKGAALHSHLFTDDGDYVRTVVEGLTGSDDPVIAQLANQFSAMVVAERDALAEQVATLTAQVTPLQTRVAELEAELDAIRNPPVSPRHIAPFDFLSLFTADELYAMLTSTDPLIVVGRAKLQTITTFVDLDNPETVSLVQYGEAIGMLAAGRAAQILAGQQ